MHYVKGKKVIYGEKGKEYGEVSREVEQTFRNWLDYSGMQQEEFDRRMKVKPHLITESINADGDIEINIFAGGEKVIVPLVFRPDDVGNPDDFIINALFLLSYIASQYEDKSFEKAVTVFADKMIREKKAAL